MRRVIFAALCAAALAVSLTACGGADNSEQAALQAENRRLTEQVSRLETERAALEAEKTALEARLQSQTEKDTGEAPAGEQNPIDAFYDGVETDGTTVAMTAVACSRADAWKAEAEHLAQALKDRLPLPEDRALVDGCLAAAREQAERMDVMSIYPIADLTVPQQDRVMSSGTLRGVLWGEGRAQVWRDTFEQLSFAYPDSDDPFAFDPTAAQAELDEILMG